ncbi:hypothetical protein NEFER03_0097 [Nematocida sp. LUAm3]|nr:hypothetical protein NEFER03_0097 [Nematocida sp. LUAm3]KAI5173550.1 hypothetical protein NEFER02_0066 [Nematocida sp. LUAm2]KAI5176771.1 hypothetical protein NEFER01_0096 [Nematocida sp. LUAm1]
MHSNSNDHNAHKESAQRENEENTQRETAQRENEENAQRESAQREERRKRAEERRGSEYYPSNPNVPHNTPHGNAPHGSGMGSRAGSGVGSGAEKKKKSGSFISLNTIYMLLFIFFMTFSLFFMLRDRLKGDPGKEAPKKSFTPEEIATYSKMFGKLTPNDCMSSKYFGLHNHFDGFSQSIMPLILHKESNIIFNDSMKNMLLYGLPGTGKTLFVKKLFFMLALNIKAHEIKEKYKLYSLDIQSILRKKSLLKEIFNCNDTIDMYMIKPGEFLDKHVGETEKTTRDFFAYIEAIQIKKPIIIFIDEVESLFAKRSGETQGGASVINNIVTEWLNWLDGAKNRSNQRIFVLAATNYKNRLDIAMHRRFGVHLGIALPDPSERAEIFSQMLLPNMANGNDPIILQKLVSSSEKLPRSTLVNNCNTLISKKMTTLIPVSIDDAEPYFKYESEQAVKKDKDERAAEKKRGLDPNEKDNPATTEKGMMGYKGDRSRNRELLIISKTEMEKIEEDVEEKKSEEKTKAKKLNKLLIGREELIDKNLLQTDQEVLEENMRYIRPLPEKETDKIGTEQKIKSSELNIKEKMGHYLMKVGSYLGS